jgi:NADH-quinone oxidoreductase subunit M
LAALLVLLNDYIIIRILGIFNLVVGGFGGIGLSRLKSVLAFSSIGHLGFIMLLSRRRLTVGVYYFVYSISLAVLIILFYFRSGRRITKFKGNIFSKIIIVAGILRLAGIPPTTGFILKWAVLQVLVCELQSPLIIYCVLILRGLIMYYYLNIALRLVLSRNENPIQEG